jgi:hypothetical protein
LKKFSAIFEQNSFVHTPLSGKTAKIGWGELDITLLLNCVERIMAMRSVHSADCHKENGRTQDCYSQEPKFESRMPQA